MDSHFCSQYCIIPAVVLTEPSGCEPGDSAGLVPGQHNIIATVCCTMNYDLSHHGTLSPPALRHMETRSNTFTTGLNLATTGERPKFQVQGFTKWGQKLQQANSKCSSCFLCWWSIFRTISKEKDGKDQNAQILGLSDDPGAGTCYCSILQSSLQTPALQ